MLAAGCATAGNGDDGGPGESCGDLVVDVGEGCDDGNTTDEDACTNACAVNLCGDGTVCAGAGCGVVAGTMVEACDDGGDGDGNYCTDACALNTCGDGAVCAGV